MKLIYLVLLVTIGCLIVLACGTEEDKTYWQQHKQEYLVSDT